MVILVIQSLVLLTLTSNIDHVAQDDPAAGTKQQRGIASVLKVETAREVVQSLLALVHQHSKDRENSKTTITTVLAALCTHQYSREPKKPVRSAKPGSTISALAAPRHFK